MAKPTRNRNCVKLVTMDFNSLGDIRYFNEFTKACREGERNAKMSLSMSDGNRIIESHLIMN